MKKTIIGLLTLLCNFCYGQDHSLPKYPYMIEFQDYKFVCETVLEHAIDLNEDLITSNFSDFQINYSTNKGAIDDDRNTEYKPIYLDDDSMRVWTYVFKNDSFLITFPTYYDTVMVENGFTHETKTIIDTINSFRINKIVDTISYKQLVQLINTELKIKFDKTYLPVRGISIIAINNQGKSYSTNFDLATISNFQDINDYLELIKYGGYFIIDFIWFLDEKEEQNGIEGLITWKIKK